jgi:NADPH:quinone reductase-like Zn-dependent oxidoreductase
MHKMTKMKAIVATGYGGPEVLEFQEVNKPSVHENEVLVQVYAASATRADTMMRTGKPLVGRLFIGLKKPKYPIPGTGFAGVVVDKGSRVTRFAIGDAVFGETTLGFSTNAEFVAVSEQGVILPKPENLSFAEASTFCDGHLTSINFLQEIAAVQPGQKVLINGASGSLGTAAVQIAKQLGAEVTGVCSTGNIGLVRQLGADHVIDYKEQDFTRSDRRYDVIFDTVGMSSFSRSKRVLQADGQYVSPVLYFPLLIQMLISSFFGRKKAKFAASGLKKDEELRNLLSVVVDMFRQGNLKTIIDRQFPLEKVAQAHQYIDLGHKKGNVVIVVSEARA